MALKFNARDDFEQRLIPDEMTLRSRVDSVTLVAKAEFTDNKTGEITVSPELFKVDFSVSDGDFKGCCASLKLKFTIAITDDMTDRQKKAASNAMKSAEKNLMILDDASGGLLSQAQEQGQDIFNARILELNLKGKFLDVEYAEWQMNGNEGNFVRNIFALENQKEDAHITQQDKNQPGANDQIPLPDYDPVQSTNDDVPF